MPFGVPSNRTSSTYACSKFDSQAIVRAILWAKRRLLSCHPVRNKGQEAECHRPDTASSYDKQGFLLVLVVPGDDEGGRAARRRPRERARESELKTTLLHQHRGRKRGKVLHYTGRLISLSTSGNSLSLYLNFAVSPSCKSCPKCFGTAAALSRGSDSHAQNK